MGDQPINIEVVGDSESCRTSAAWLRTLAKGMGDLASTFARTGGQSESFWHGAASDAFRGSMSNARSNASQVEEVASTSAQALSGFAEDLDTVKRRIDQAKQVAAGAGLTVTDKEIQPPDAGPGAGPQTPPGNASPQQLQEHDQAVQQHNAAVAAHHAKVAAFNEVSGTVSEARGKERAAHDALQAATKKQDETLGALKTYGTMALTKSVALVGGLTSASKTLLESSEKNQALATLATALRASPTLPAEADAALKSVQQELFESAYKDGVKRDSLEKIIGKMPEGTRRLFTLNASDVVKKLGGIDKGIPAAFQEGLPVLKRLPIAGTLLTAGTAAIDIHEGKDPVKTTENAVGGTAAAIGVSAGVDGAVAAATAAGLAVPGPGWVAAGTLVLGTAAAYGVGYVVDNYGDQINHAVGSAASSVGDAVGGAAKGVGHFAGDLF